MKYIGICIAILVAQISIAQTKQATAFTKNTATAVDAIFNKAYPVNGPGATVLIAKDDKIMYRKAFGKSNLELNTPMKPETVMQLASITKQFTSVAILMLMEQGKLSLQDSLSKYITDYPRGNEITIHHLLNHVSGIKSYTNLPAFSTKTRLDLSPEEIINTVKNLPLDFNPNEQYAYSNSGYLLLGYIIEQVTGLSYAAFIQQNIFDKLGMKHSYYADSYSIIPNRANGYLLYEGKYENAEYMSPTIPYAAGSLMSTIDDLFLWSKAIHHNKLISAKTRQLAFTNYALNNGKHNNYGYGWEINEIAGTSTIEHPGGINGFTTSGIYVPEQNMYAIVLSNLDDGKGPATYNIKAVAALLGKPITEQPAAAISEQALQKWVGAYQFEDVVRFISYEKGALYSTREGGCPLKLVPLAADAYKFENSFATYQFAVSDGKKRVLYADRIAKSRGVETDKQPLTAQEAIQLTPAQLARYTGVYELAPSFQVSIEIQNGRLMATATGQPPVELFAASEQAFFIKEIGAQVLFHINTDGTVQSLVFAQGGNKMEGKKVK